MKSSTGGGGTGEPEVKYGLVTFAANGGLTAAGSAPSDRTGVVGTAVEPSSMPVVSKAGYAFKGWYASSDFSGSEVTTLGNYSAGVTTYYAKWEAEKHSFSFQTNNGQPQPQTIVLDTDTAIDDRSLPVVTRDGYTFAGWYTDATFSPDAKVTALPETMPAFDVIYYADWTANEARIEFDADGGSPVTALVGKTDQAIADTAMPSTTREGYEFVDWVDADGQAVGTLPGKFPAGTTTYKATWTAKTVTITWDANAEGMSVDSWTGTFGEPTGKTLPELTRNDFTLVGWYTEDGAKLEAAPATFPANDVTYKAKWLEAGTGTIVFNTNGGTPVSDYVRSGWLGNSDDHAYDHARGLRLRRLVRQPGAEGCGSDSPERHVHRERDHLLRQVDRADARREVRGRRGCHHGGRRERCNRRSNRRPHHARDDARRLDAGRLVQHAGRLRRFYEHGDRRLGHEG